MPTRTIRFWTTLYRAGQEKHVADTLELSTGRNVSVSPDRLQELSQELAQRIAAYVGEEQRRVTEVLLRVSV